MITKNKRAAMEMSIGTIVTIVLLMTVLIMGLVLVRTVFKSGGDSIEQIDRALQNEINKLFAEEGKKVVVYPPSRELVLKKGENKGFGFSIRNNDQTDGIFSYEVVASEIATGCRMTLDEANALITLGKSGGNLQLTSGSYMEDAVLVKFRISDEVPLCTIRYVISVEKDGVSYVSGLSVDLEIK